MSAYFFLSSVSFLSSLNNSSTFLFLFLTKIMTIMTIVITTTGITMDKEIINAVLFPLFSLVPSVPLAPSEPSVPSGPSDPSESSEPSLLSVVSLLSVSSVFPLSSLFIK